jgi:hypothetical protein
MSALLWLSEAEDKALDLGNPLVLLQTFARMAEVCGEERYNADFKELFGVPNATMDQEDVDPDWLATVREQAGKFLREFRSRLDVEAKVTLEELMHGTGESEDGGEEGEEADEEG